MKIAAQKINQSGVVISKLKTMQVYQGYIKKFNNLVAQLVDNYYLTSYYFDVDEFWKTYFDTYPKLSSYFCDSISGDIRLTVEHSEYVIELLSRKIVDEDDDALVILKIFTEALDCWNAIQTLNSFIERAKFKKKSDLITCKVCFTVSGGVFNSGKIPFDSKYVMECYYLEDDSRLVVCDYSVEIYKTILKKLDKPVDNINLEDKALFLGDGFTISDECKFIRLLSSGEITGNGIYAAELHKLIEDYYSEYYVTKTTIANKVGYANQLYTDSLDNCVALVNKFRSDLTCEYKEFFLDSSKVYFKIKGIREKTKGTGTYSFHVGSYLVDQDGKDIGGVSRIFGLCGIFVSESDILLNNYKTYGFPISVSTAIGELGNSLVSTTNYYPIYNVKKESSDGTYIDLYSDYTGSDYKDYDKVLEELEITSDTLVEEIAGVVKKRCVKNQALFNKLVGIFFQAMLCVKCNYTLPDHDSPGHIILGSDYSWVTESIFRDACIETEVLFRDLNI